MENFVCQNCQHPCSLCEERKGPSGFTQSMWHHRFSRTALCLDCCKPKCTSAHCETCTTCRDPACTRRGRCKKPIVPLHPKQFLGSKEELTTYLCERCRYITCACGKIMPKTTQKRKKKAGTLGQQVYVCTDCESRTQWHQDAQVRAT